MVYSIKIPVIPGTHHKANALGLKIDDYRGAPSTLCGGCGHDAISTAIMQACFELAIPPEKLVKLSGIGCSSKTPAYFVRGAHAFNAIHGRMPAIATGANMANRDLIYLAVSGDGDTANIGVGSFVHAVKRRLNITYLVENNGVFGLTKGQFSSTADKGSKSKRGLVHDEAGFDLVEWAVQLGASFAARSFSANKAQLVPLLKTAMSTKGFALIDILSPCVSFNNHDGSTKSYAFVREHEFALDQAFNDRTDALRFLIDKRREGVILTGGIFLKPDAHDFHDHNHSDRRPLNQIPFEELSPGLLALEAINAQFR
ncbi:MAG: 2-oxoacid:ferredoxin oxidoreductase subunit beta [Deltaproteobacteria bacterium]|nr:2-oxoacid:ferredoxin oxidoreductase subunit beta [Deltaproteobacteria bacterium]